MFRCFTIATVFHVGLILGLLVLSFIAPPTPKIPPMMSININPNTLGTPGLPEGDPNLSPIAGNPPKVQETPAPKDAEPAPTPKPASTPKPAATPAPPKPTPAKKQIVNPKTTPLPKPEVTQKKAVPTVKRPVKKIAEPVKKIIVPDKKKKLFERNLKPAPTPKPTPEPKEEVVAEVTDQTAPDVPQEPPVAEFDKKPDIPAAPDVPEPPPSSPPVGPGGQGTGQKLSPHHTIAGGIGLGVPGGGGGSGGTTGGYGYGSLLNDLAQTYFAIVLQKIEENFKLPYSRPGVLCVVQFQIEKAGTISNIQVVKSSGFANLDSLAVQALQMTKLPALYDGIKANALPVTLTFDYEKKD